MWQLPVTIRVVASAVLIWVLIKSRLTLQWDSHSFARFANNSASLSIHLWLLASAEWRHFVPSTWRCCLCTAVVAAILVTSLHGSGTINWHFASPTPTTCFKLAAPSLYCEQLTFEEWMRKQWRRTIGGLLSLPVVLRFAPFGEHAPAPYRSKNKEITALISTLKFAGLLSPLKI